MQPPTPHARRLGRCFECDGAVSVSAASCPHCGAVLKPRKGVFYYVFWGTLSLIATLAILYGASFILMAFGVGILSGFSSSNRSSQDTHSTSAALVEGEQQAPTIDPDKALSLVRWEWDKHFITGALSNKSGSKVPGILISFDVLLPNGRLIAKPKDFKDEIGPGEIWRFKIPLADRRLGEKVEPSAILANWKREWLDH